MCCADGQCARCIAERERAQITVPKTSNKTIARLMLRRDGMIEIEFQSPKGKRKTYEYYHQ